MGNQKTYLKDLTEKESTKYFELKEIFIKDVFDERLNTHVIYEKQWVKVYSAYINKKDRIIFFYKDNNKVCLYKIMYNHDYKKLLDNINSILTSFLKNF